MALTSSQPSMPRSVFVSYAHEDAGFVDLLVELLRFHRIEPWHDCKNISPATTSLSRSVAQGLRETDAMLVVASPHAVASDWVKREVLVFSHAKADSIVIPLVIAPCRIDAVSPELADRVSIDFMTNQLQAYQRLMVALGRVFLPASEQRARASERRSGNVAQRLEFALARIVERQPEMSLHEALPYEHEHRLLHSALSAFHAELQRGYCLLDEDGKEVRLSRDGFLNMAFSALEQPMTSTLERLVPSFLITHVVRQLLAVFRVTLRDRRQLEAARDVRAMVADVPAFAPTHRLAVSPRGVDRSVNALNHGF